MGSKSARTPAGDPWGPGGCDLCTFRGAWERVTIVTMTGPRPSVRQALRSSHSRCLLHLSPGPASPTWPSTCGVLAERVQNMSAGPSSSARSQPSPTCSQTPSPHGVLQPEGTAQGVLAVRAFQSDASKATRGNRASMGGAVAAGSISGSAGVGVEGNEVGAGARGPPGRPPNAAPRIYTAPWVPHLGPVGRRAGCEFCHSSPAVRPGRASVSSSAP